MRGISAKAERKQNGGKQSGAVDRGIDEADPGLVNLTLIHCQFCPNLALLHHTPHEVMWVSGGFVGKK